MKYQYDFLKKSITISLTRITGVLLLTIDIISLKSSSLEISNFTIATQFIQLFLVIIISSTIGINILSNEIKNKNLISIFFTYYTILSFIIGILSLVALQFLYYYQNYDVVSIYIILAISLLFLGPYLSIISYLESKGLEKLVFIISIIFLLINYFLNYIFIKNIPTNNAICVALSTLIVRILNLIVFYLIFKVKFNQLIKFNFDFTIFKRLFNYSATSMLTSSIFTGTFAIIIYAVSFILNNNDIAILGITLNFMNIISIFFVGLNITTSIELAKFKKNQIIINKIILSTINYFIIINILFLLISQLVNKIYWNLGNKLTFILIISLIIVFFDSLVNYLISILRVLNISILPPLFRTPIIFIGLPLSLYLIQYFNVLGILYALITSSIISLIMTIIYFLLNINKIYNNLIKN